MDNIIGDNIKLVYEKLRLKQTVIAYEMGKEQSWVSTKLNALGSDPNKLSDANRGFIKNILEAINKYSDYKLTVEEITSLNFAVLSGDEVNDIPIQLCMERVKERQPDFSIWLSRIERDNQELDRKFKNTVRERNRVFLVAVITVSIFLTCFFCSSSPDAPHCPNSDNPGSLYVENFATFTKEIYLCGYFCDFNQGRRAWLFFNKNLPDGSVIQWPKGIRQVTEGEYEDVIKPDKYGNWCATIFEFGSDEDTIFDVELISVDSIGHLEIRKWIDDGFKTEKFPPFKFSSRDRFFSLDLVEGIKIIKSPPEE